MRSVYSEEFRILGMGQSIMKGGKGILIQKINKYLFLFNIHWLLVFTLPKLSSVWAMCHYFSVYCCNFFSVGLVFFYTRYMGWWFMSAFRPCEWNASRSSKTRTGYSGKKYWDNQHSKGKCLMNVIFTGLHEESAFILECKILVNDPSLSIL